MDPRIIGTGLVLAGALHRFQAVRNLTGFGSQGVGGQFRRYRGSVTTHNELSQLLANPALAHLDPNAAGTAGAITAGAWRITAILQLFHDPTTWAVAGQGGHLSLMLWNVTTMQCLSFHMNMARGPNNHPTLGGALYPLPVLQIFHVLANGLAPNQTVGMGPLMHLTPTNSGQDVWFYTHRAPVPPASATAMLNRIVHHLGNAATYGNNMLFGIRQLGYWTCLTIGDDVLEAGGYSRGIASTITPWTYSYSFFGWEATMVADWRMIHLLPFQQTGAGPLRGIRRYVGVGPTLHWNDITTNPTHITDVWDPATLALAPIAPPQIMHHDY